MLRQFTAPPRVAVVATLTTALVCVLALTLLPTAVASNVSDVAQGVAALAAADLLESDREALDPTA